jgi:hypothetical protein
MDIYKAIHDLMQEKKRLDAVIASLETRSGGGVREKSRRGRKSMSAEERAIVSKRMAAYWAARRGQVATPPRPAETTAAPVEIPPPAELARAASGFDAVL